MFVDSHAHLDGEEFDADREEALARARAAGIRWILTIGTGDPKSDSLARAVRLAEKHSDVLAAAGVHPHDARLFDDQAEGQLATLLTSSVKVVALGEIGLDYHYDHSPRDIQREVFTRQLALAASLKLPVIIHSRAANEDTVEILGRDWAGEQQRRPGVMHCFSAGPKMAEDLLAEGFYISFAGNVTFKNAEEVRDAARVVPLDRLLIETDCPYLSPVPLRGRRNEPANVITTARFLAQLKGLDVEELGRATTGNFERVFNVGSIGGAKI